MYMYRFALCETFDLNFKVFLNFENECEPKSWPRGYKTFFVLNTVEHEILIAHKYKNIKKFGIFSLR